MSTNDRKAKIEEIIALNTERHKRLQEMEDFEAYYRANILQTLDEIVLQVASERARETSTDRAPGQASRKSTTIRDFFARFDGAYQALMEAMFPGLALSPSRSTVRIGTRSGNADPAVAGGSGIASAPSRSRSGTAEPGAADAEAPQDPAQPRALTPAQEEARASLPAWVVVPYAGALLPGTEFAILWAGEGAAPDLPPLELRLDGQPRDENLFWTEVKTNLPGLPPGDVTFVQFDRLTPAAFTMTAREDGILVIDFATT